MNLYLISLKEEEDIGDEYDVYDGAVVCAKSKDKALLLALHSCHNFNMNNVECEFLGKADMKQVEGVILVSFNAG